MSGAVLAETWNCTASIAKVRAVVMCWKTLTAEMLGELWTARDRLARPGARTDLSADADRSMTWGEYCEAVGISLDSAARWLGRFDPVRKRLIDEPRKALPLDRGEAAILFERHEVRIPGSAVVLLWDGPAIMADYDADPVAALNRACHTLTEILRTLTEVACRQGDAALLEATYELVAWWAREEAELLLCIEARIGELLADAQAAGGGE